jgi:hypothetical protein
MSAVAILAWRPRLKDGALGGFVNVEMASALVFMDLHVFAQCGKRWVAPPGRPALDKVDARCSIHPGSRSISPPSRGRVIGGRWAGMGRTERIRSWGVAGGNRGLGA